MTIRQHINDLPAGLDLGETVAIDTETMGLKMNRDRLCLVQLSAGDGDAHIVRITGEHGPAPGLEKILTDPRVLKLFHFGRFDIAVLQTRFGVAVSPVYCTKIASRFARTYTDRHGLRDLAKDLLGIEISKQQQSSDWGRGDLSQDQLGYAAGDVLYLHRLRDELNAMLAREGREHLAEACFRFLPDLANIDASGWSDQDVFAH